MQHIQKLMLIGLLLAYPVSVGGIDLSTCSGGTSLGYGMQTYCGDVEALSGTRVYQGGNTYAFDTSSGTIETAVYKGGCLTDEILSGTGLKLSSEICPDEDKPYVDPDSSTCACVECLTDAHCSDDENCVNGSCCSTPNADATECCSYGVGTNGACCIVDSSTCTNGTTTDENGCEVCEEASLSGCATAVADCESWCATVDYCQAGTCYVENAVGPTPCSDGKLCSNRIGSELVDCTGGVYYQCRIYYYNTDYDTMGSFENYAISRCG